MTVIPYEFGDGKVHVKLHCPVEAEVLADPAGYDHVIPVPVISVVNAAESTIFGTGQHPLSDNVVPVAAVYFVYPPLGHALI
jgi:hypothetical protein